MKIIYAIIFILSSWLHATNQELFLQGNKEYEYHNYQKALDLYNAIENKGEAVWYNMGLCCYNMDEYVQALVYWHKAEHVSRSQELLDSIAKNKKRAQEKLQVQVPHSYYTSMLQTIVYCTSWCALVWWQLLFVIVWCISILYARFLWRAGKWLLMIFLWGAIIGLGIIITVHYITYARQEAIIIKPATAFTIGPDSNFASQGILALGQVVEVQRKQDDWVKIIYDSKMGWVRAEALALV
jgi:tetratricopeptide (TPR) repeat protein